MENEKISLSQLGYLVKYSCDIHDSGFVDYPPKELIIAAFTEYHEGKAWIAKKSGNFGQIRAAATQSLGLNIVPVMAQAFRDAQDDYLASGASPDASRYHAIEDVLDDYMNAFLKEMHKLTCELPRGCDDASDMTHDQAEIQLTKIYGLWNFLKQHRIIW